MPRYRNYRSRFPPPSRPRPAPDGIRARNRRGRIGETWWSGRFIEILESYGMGARLSRGRRYARSGQVLEMEIAKGKVTARVQGSRVRPYKVRISARPLSAADWARAEKAMAKRAVFLAKLLAGEMPRDIEEAFRESRLSLFPRSRRALVTECGCPDWENPCKHIAAVFYILAEAFDEDPFLIFRWRGRERDQLIAGLRTRRGAVKSQSGRPARRQAELSLDQAVDRFWSQGAGIEDVQVSPRKAPAPQASITALGSLESVGKDLVEWLVPVYEAMAEGAERLAASWEGPDAG